jgi:hypothetical protein
VQEKRSTEKKTLTSAELETVHTAKRTLRAWLISLEDVGILKPGAAVRILMSGKLKAIVIPPSPLRGDKP